MSDYGTNQGDLAFKNLRDLIEGIELGLINLPWMARAAIDDLVHDAAVGLLHSFLPPVVHAGNLRVRAEKWTELEALTLALAADLANSSVDSAVLAGQVAKKVQEGVGHITSDLDYTRGVNSIT